MVAKIIRIDESLSSPPKPDAFTPRFLAAAASPALADEYAKYPPYRTAQGALPALAGEDGPRFHRADYWHVVLPGPNGTEPNTKTGIASWDHPACPLGDMTSDIPTAVLFDGAMMIDTPGDYRFRVETTLPVSLTVDGESKTSVPPYARIKATLKKRFPGNDAKKQGLAMQAEWPSHTVDLRVELSSGIVPFKMVLARAKLDVPPRGRILWQRPGDDDFSVLPSALFVHAVTPEVETAYRKFGNGYPWRQLTVKPQKAASTDVAALASAFDPTSHVSSDADYRAMHTKLEAGFLGDPVWGGSVELGHNLLALINARFAYLRSHPEQLSPQSGSGKVRGDLMQHAVALRPFMEACLRNPQLQQRALATRVELQRFAGTVLKRPFFTEENAGTNDGYSDQDNFLVNVWRAAEAWDDPVAYDAACSLHDNHFRCAPEGQEGLHSDAIYSFHCANGRHVNMGGYGRDWMARVMTQSRIGTPWGCTQEQYRRMADWALAYEWFFFNGAAAFTVNGRHNKHIGRYDTGFADRLLGLPDGILSPHQRDRLTTMRARLEKNSPLSGNVFFFRHLQMIHRRDDYYIDVKMNSPLVGGVETFAGAHPGNLSFGDGVTTLLRHGDEYRAIHTDAYDITKALWRYRSLPGTTQNNYESANADGRNNPDRYRGGGGSRSGGVSDGEYGHCGFEFNHLTQARKFFACTDDGLVVLANGITGDRPSPAGDYSYRSNVNQCVLQTDVVVTDARGQSFTIRAEESRHIALPLDQKYWVAHSDIAYLVLPTGAERGPGKPGELVVRTALRTPLNRLGPAIMETPAMAPYRDRCRQAAEATPPVQSRVLEIWIDHGTAAPSNASCAYFACMRPQRRTPEAWMADTGFDILANTATCQAVRDTDARVLHAFFYKPGRVAEITVGQPTSLMLRTLAAGKRRLTVQDPVAACTRDMATMSDVARVTIDGMDHELRMTGAGDPDDRYRGGLTSIELPKQ